MRVIWILWWDITTGSQPDKDARATGTTRRNKPRRSSEPLPRVVRGLRLGGLGSRRERYGGVGALAQGAGGAPLPGTARYHPGALPWAARDHDAADQLHE